MNAMGHGGEVGSGATDQSPSGTGVTDGDDPGGQDQPTSTTTGGTTGTTTGGTPSSGTTPTGGTPSSGSTSTAVTNTGTSTPVTSSGYTMPTWLKWTVAIALIGGIGYLGWRLWE